MKPTTDIEAVRARLQAAGFIVTADDRISEKAAAAVIGCAPKTLKNWRAAGKGPASVSICRRRWYRLEDLARWLAATQFPGTSREVPPGPARASTKRSARQRLYA